MRVARDGSIALIAARAGVLGPPGTTTPVNAALSAGGRASFVLDRRSVRIAVFEIDPDGALTPTRCGGELPPSVVALAAN